MSTNIYTLTTAKAKLSLIISEVEHKKQTILISRKGKNVAVIIPIHEYKTKIASKDKKGLILAKGALSDLNILDDFVDNIYQARDKEIDREVNL